MSRVCRTCQHVKRAEIDRRLAAGEPAAQLAHDYELNPSSLYRHRSNCLKLGSSNAIMKEAARGGFCSRPASNLRATMSMRSNSKTALGFWPCPETTRRSVA